MTTIKFKTSINCNNCIRSVSGFIDEIEGVKSWEVDTGNPDKILCVTGESIKPEMIIAAVSEAGYDIEILPE